MRDGGRIQAAIEVVEAVITHHTPVKDALREWGRSHRFAGSGDRAWISGLALDALRFRASSEYLFKTDSSRALVLGALKTGWNFTIQDYAAVIEGDEHAPSPLSDAEQEGFARDLDDAPDHIQAVVPDWIMVSLKRAYGPDAILEARGMASRAPVDLRVNALKADPEKALAAVVSKLKDAVPSELLKQAIRIAQPDARSKSPAADAIPAYGKGWVEVQDLGSQIAALASGVKPGHQVLDFCAGAGGKTLALAALMENAGQIHAWDIDWRRLRAIWPRLKRAGVRNTQVHDGKEAALSDLIGKMDVVFVDAPCTGSGTWRRRPDAKWRIRETALERRMKEQALVLDNAVKYVKPGGRLVYVTCSILPEENDDQIKAFLTRHETVSVVPALDVMSSTGQLTDEGQIQIGACADDRGAIQLTPARCGTDGFYVCVMEKSG